MGYKTALLVITFLVGSFASQECKIDFFLREDGISPRIVGGNTAPSQSHPHMVALTSGVLIRSFTCGGSLITRRTVLTAAHCIRDSMSGSTLSSNVRVRIGSNQWNSGTEYHLSRGIMHPNYNHANIKNDVAILITAINVPFNNNIQPITVNYSNVGGNVAVRVAGWGRTGANAPISNNLLQVDLTTITGQDCVNRVQQATVNLGVRAPPVDPQIELCTLRATGFGTCNGDSGSALRRIDNGQQVGVVSWGFPCARGAPDIFVRVSAFRSFIESNTVS